MIAAALHPSGQVRAVPGFLAEASTTASGFGLIEGENTLVADLVDDAGERYGSFCADTVQDREIGLLGTGSAQLSVTGLVPQVRIYPDQVAFDASDDGWLVRPGTPIELPDGRTLDQARAGVPSFFPDGAAEYRSSSWHPLCAWS
ncbi:hypothetical protein [Gordonia sp. VNK21]|uniref:hypothetical protein n=1 Tax=Gordonia sp. VNK21 TaxID=3382483 RepID=UPI0038D485B2